MIQPHEEELLQRDLDGALSTEEQAALSGLLTGNRALAARREELRRLRELLAGLAEEPPPELAKGVMRQITAERQQPAGLFGFLEAVRASFARPAIRRPALALAAGIVLGAASSLLVLSARMPAGPEGGFSATVLPGVRLTPAEVVDQARFEEKDIRGEVTTRQVDGRLLAEIRIDSPGVAEVVVEFAERDFTAVGFERASGSAARLALEPGRLRLTDVAEGLYRLVLQARTDEPSVLRIAVSAGERRVERSLRSRPAGVKTSDSTVSRPQAWAAANFGAFRM